MRAQDYEHALAQYEEVLRGDHSSRAALYGAGFAAFQLGHHRTAEGYLQNAVRSDPDNSQARQLLEKDTQILHSDPFARHISDAERLQRMRSAFQVAGERLDNCAKSKAIDLSPTSPASGLPLLKTRWLTMKPKLESLRRPGDGGALDSVMDLVYEIEQQTQAVCGNPEGPDQVLLLLSQDRARSGEMTPGTPIGLEADLRTPAPVDSTGRKRPDRSWLTLSTTREERFFLALAVFIGVFSGLAVVCFRLAIDWTKIWLLGPVPEPHSWRLIAAPALTSLVVAILVIHVFPLVRGSGVNQTKAALYIYNGYIPFRTAIGKFITAALAIGSGQSLGTGGSVTANWRQPCFRAWQAARSFPRTFAPDGSGGRSGGIGSGFQRSNLGCAVCH